MATQLADSTDAAAETPQDPPPEAVGDGSQSLEAPTQVPPGAGCASCGAPLAPGQDWCLQCGSGVPGSVESGGWRGVAAIAAATVLLVLGAAAAGYAALSKHQRRAPVRTTTVAQATPPAATPPATTPPQTFSTPTPSVPSLTKPPKIPLKTSTPTGTVPTTPTTTPKSTEKSGSSDTGGSSGEKQLEPILLDTDAAATYNPYNYPAQEFGDPSLAIDGDGSTGWTAQVNPATAPKLAEGLLIDLKSAQKVATVKLITATPGMTVQVYGSTAATPPASITDPEWVPLSHAVKLHKRHARLRLDKPKRAFRYIVLWISAAPESSVGTPEAPGHVSVNELELFPPA